jgi:hypothetical protein
MPVKRTTRQTTAKKTTAARRKPAPERRRRKAAPGTGDPLHDAWASALDALHSAQDEVEKQLQAFRKKQRIAGKDAASVMRSLKERFAQERSKVVAELETEMTGLQARLSKERKVLSKTVGDAVRGTLAAFNVPSRKEVVELTRKVDQLSRKIDSLSTPRRRTPRAK